MDSPTKCSMDFCIYNKDVSDIFDIDNISVKKQCNESELNDAEFKNIIDSYAKKYNCLNVKEFVINGLFKNNDEMKKMDIEIILRNYYRFKNIDGNYFSFNFGNLFFDAIGWMIVLNTFVKFIY